MTKEKHLSVDSTKKRSSFGFFSNRKSRDLEKNQDDISSGSDEPHPDAIVTVDPVGAKQAAELQPASFASMFRYVTVDILHVFSFIAVQFCYPFRATSQCPRYPMCDRRRRSSTAYVPYIRQLNEHLYQVWNHCQ